MWYRFSQSKRDDFLRTIGADQTLIDFVNAHSDKSNVLVSAIHKNPQISIEELQKLIAPKQQSKLKEISQAFEKILRSYFATRTDLPQDFTNWLILNYLKKFRSNPNDQQFLHDIIQGRGNFYELYDFYRNTLIDNPRFDINSYNLQQIEQMSHEWHEAMAQRGSGNIYLPLKNENVIHRFKNGWKLVIVDNENDLEVEGHLMNHCVGSYAHEVEKENIKILSLRDASNKPHVTIEASPDLKEIYQIKGASNSVPKPEYKELLKEYFEKTDATYNEEDTIQDKVDELKYTDERKYDEELNDILFPKENIRDEYGLKVKPSEYDNVYEMVHEVSNHVIKGEFNRYYISDIAKTLAKFAYLREINWIKEIIHQGQLLTEDLYKNFPLNEAKYDAETVFNDFYENWYYEQSHYDGPEEENYDTDEEYQNAMEDYIKNQEEEENFAIKEAIANDKKLRFYQELIDEVNDYLDDATLKDLKSKAMHPKLPLAFNLHKYKKQATNTQESLFFEPWHEGYLIKDEQGKPKKLFHGTLSPNIQMFDPEKYESDASFGSAIYTTEDPHDAYKNYANPLSNDWRAKIGTLTEKYEQEDEDKDPDDEYFQTDQPPARVRAEQEIIDKAQPNIFPLYGKMKKPAYFNPKGKQQVFEMYTWNEELDDFEPGEGAIILDELKEMLDEYDYPDNDNKINIKIDQIKKDIGSEFTFAELYEAMQDHLSFYDYDINSGNFIQELVRRLGYDGIIMNAEKYWPQLVDKPTKHYIFFNPTQVKSIYNRTFDPHERQLNATNLSWYKLAKQAMIKTANEYWFHDNQAEFADGDVGDRNHEMIAEDYILRSFIPNIPEVFEDLVSEQDLNDFSVRDVDFLQYLMDKYNYTEYDAIDNAYSGNYIRWLITGNDEAESPIIKELLHALKDPRKYAVEKLGWIRVHGNNIETQNLDQEHLDEIIYGLNDVFGDPTNKVFNIDVWMPHKYLKNVPYHEIEDGTVTKRLKELISDQPELNIIPFTQTKTPGYKYPGG